jgi:hypothetical protein
MLRVIEKSSIQLLEIISMIIAGVRIMQRRAQ